MPHLKKQMRHDQALERQAKHNALTIDQKIFKVVDRNKAKGGASAKEVERLIQKKAGQEKQTKEKV